MGINKIFNIIVTIKVIAADHVVYCGSPLPLKSADITLLIDIPKIPGRSQRKGGTEGRKGSPYINGIAHMPITPIRTASDDVNNKVIRHARAVIAEATLVSSPATFGKRALLTALGTYHINSAVLTLVLYKPTADGLIK